MKWLMLAIVAEILVLLCLIFSFDSALHSWASARLTWDDVAVAIAYAYVRVAFSRKRLGHPGAGSRWPAAESVRLPDPGYRLPD